MTDPDPREDLKQLEETAKALKLAASTDTLSLCAGLAAALLTIAVELRRLHELLDERLPHHQQTPPTRP